MITIAQLCLTHDFDKMTSWLLEMFGAQKNFHFINNLNARERHLTLSTQRVQI